MDDSVDVFFAEFVGNILIRDWTKILSQNSPLAIPTSRDPRRP